MSLSSEYLAARRRVARHSTRRGYTSSSQDLVSIQRPPFVASLLQSTDPLERCQVHRRRPRRLWVLGPERGAVQYSLGAVEPSPAQGLVAGGNRPLRR